MLALLAALMLTSPMPAPAGPVCRLWWSETEHRCRDADVQVIGSWDPRPLSWSESYYVSPPEWGSFSCEQPAPVSSSDP